jgi:hypothetical protein
MSEENPGQVTAQAPEGVSGRFVGWVLAIVVLLTLAMIGVARLLLDTDFHEIRSPVRAPAYPRAQTVGDIEQPSIWGSAEGEGKNRRSNATLNEYGWVDGGRRIAQIPIDRAMQWLVDDANRGALKHPDPATTPDSGASGGPD